jgi:hypothetical protein
VVTMRSRGIWRCRRGGFTPKSVERLGGGLLFRRRLGMSGVFRKEISLAL